MSERRVQQCKICKEWFNATDEIMVEHRKQHIGFITVPINISVDFTAFAEAMKKAISACMSIRVGGLK